MKQVDFSKTVMEQIEKEQIRMRPAYYFMLKSLLFKTGLTLLFILALYFINLTVFKFRIYNPFGYLLFGTTGLKALSGSIPWLITGTSLILSFMFLTLIKKSSLIYNVNFNKTILSLMIFFILGGITIDQTGINEQAKASGKIPLLYQGVFNSEYWVMGKVISVDISSKKLVVYTPNKETVEVIWEASTLLPSGSDFQLGQTIQAIGEKENDHSPLLATGINIQ